MSSKHEKHGEATKTPVPSESATAPPTCGLIMPISTIDDCGEGHWKDVQTILSGAILAAKFQPRIVSDANDVGVIQGRIIQNLYNDPIVVCDVSCKNPNVMFELGMRLAFDKPTVIVKDDRTNYSFDTGQIEHLQYPRTLRHPDILAFSQNLTAKVRATFDRSKTDPNYTTFLKHFGTFKVASLEERDASISEVLLQMSNEMSSLRRRLDEQSEWLPSRGRSLFASNTELGSGINVSQLELFKSLVKDRVAYELQHQSSGSAIQRFPRLSEEARRKLLGEITTEAVMKFGMKLAPSFIISMLDQAVSELSPPGGASTK